MAKRKKRPNLENYLTTGKVHWEERKEGHTSFEKNIHEPLLDSPVAERASLTEKEERFLAMLEPQDKELWEPRFRKSVVSFSPLQVMEERKTFEERARRGKIFKLRRRKYPLEQVREEKDIAFPLLALLEEGENTVIVRSNHMEP